MQLEHVAQIAPGIDDRADRGDPTEDGLEDRQPSYDLVPPTVTALYIVTPAHVSGAASNGSIASGTRPP
jgi:hypothetical protein